MTDDRAVRLALEVGRLTAERDALAAKVAELHAAVDGARLRMARLADDQREAMECAGTFETHLIASIDIYSAACDDLTTVLGA